MLIGYSAVDEKPTCLCEDTPASTPTSRGGLSDGVCIVLSPLSALRSGTRGGLWELSD